MMTINNFGDDDNIFDNGENLDNACQELEMDNQLNTHLNNLEQHNTFPDPHHTHQTSNNGENSGFLGASTRPNIFGGYDIYDGNNQLVGNTKPNIFGGQDVFDAHNTKIASSQPNIFNGSNIKFK